MYNGVCVRYLVICVVAVIIIIVQVSGVGVRVSITWYGKARDYDLLAMDNLWTGRDGGTASFSLFFCL